MLLLSQILLELICNFFHPQADVTHHPPTTKRFFFFFSPLLQDTLGGGFDATQAYVGELANLNIWNRKLSVSEIKNLASCSVKAPVGNVFSWTESNIEIFGGATKWTFEACRWLN